MASYEDRYAQIVKITEDPLLSPREKIAFILTWMRFEYAIIRRDRLETKIVRLSDSLKNRIHQFNFRHELTKL